MANITLYARDEADGLWNEAKALAGERGLSQFVEEAVRTAVEVRRIETAEAGEELAALPQGIRVAFAYWRAERRRELDARREQQIFELERNLEVLQTPGGDVVYRLHNAAWNTLQCSTLFDPDVQRRIDWFYTSAFDLLNNLTASDSKTVTFRSLGGEEEVRVAAIQVLNGLLDGIELRRRCGLHKKWTPLPGSSFRPVPVKEPTTGEA